MTELEGWEKEKLREALDIVLTYLGELGEDVEGNEWAEFKRKLEEEEKI